MAEVFTRMTKDDLPECLGFLAKAFKKDDPQAFKKLFPRIMRPSDETMNAHHCIKLDGKIVGMAASYPFILKYGDLSLKVSGSGNIAVDEACRGKGYMSELLNYTAKKDKKDGFAFSYFHGNEARYRRFGYHKCGVQVSFDINSRFFDPKLDISDITFENLNEQSDEILRKAYELYQTQYHFERSFEEYKLALPSNGSTNYAVFKNGEFIGYIVQVDYIKNIYLSDLNDFAVTMKAYLNFKNTATVCYVVPDTEYKIMRTAIKYSESYRMWPPANFRIYDFKKTVEFFLAVKLTNGSFEGGFTIDSDIFGKWEIKVENGVPSVNEFDGDAEFKLLGLDVYDFLFAGNGAFRQNLTSGANAILPIPIYCPYLN
ncbi:MAG: GNAT family N-acetyltransferase [Clostridia bacterium]|nr:GNAT family N-acetyltransferase [Clostridia bacterium]